jgi:Ca-activated chloride channel family protein
MNRTGRILASALSVAALLAAACTPQNGTDERDDAPRPGTLRVLASSELADMEPVLERIAEDTGIEVRPTYMGTLDAVELLADGRADGRYDALWLSSNDYLRLRPEAARRIVSETSVMASPVAVGIRTTALDALGWKPEEVTWSHVERAVQTGELTYGMTDPARSNSGFATLVSVASALSDAQSALTDADVRKASARLKGFFRGQKLTSGSSGWPATAYERSGSVDALLNYESGLQGTPDLTVIRPVDGVLTADNPLSSLAAADAATREDVHRRTEALRSAEVHARTSGFCSVRSPGRQAARRPHTPACSPRHRSPSRARRLPCTVGGARPGRR